MHISKLLHICIILLIAIVTACSHTNQDSPLLEGKGIYFWRTVFQLSEEEKDFIIENDIQKLYVHFFDVVIKDNKWNPEATLSFTTSFPKNIEIIPTVFIDSKALTLRDSISSLAPLILARVDSMMTKNGYPIAQELQIDFDWAPSNRERYFSLLSQLNDSLHKKNRILSTTIRLHQLRDVAPPVDYGVLMAYNIGNFKDPEEVNSILSIPTLKKFITPLKNYPLPLRPALPIYNWNIIFSQGKFLAISREMNLSDTTLYKPLGTNHFMVKSYMPLPIGSSGTSPTGRLYPGDIIRHESVSTETLDSALSIFASLRSNVNKGLILYHLDNNSIKTYQKNEFKKIYNHR